MSAVDFGAEHHAGESPKVDRIGWPKGPWDDEPDRVDWKTVAGFPAIALRHSSGHWCGYVGLPLDHPAYGKSDEDVVDVHGGITYAGKCAGYVCHIASPGEPDEVFWLGFDFAHCNDVSPNAFDEKNGWVEWSKDDRVGYWGPSATMCRGQIKGHYRDIAYVREQCERVGAQLGAMEAPTAPDPDCECPDCLSEVSGG
jgi:hypothetical protein